MHPPPAVRGGAAGIAHEQRRLVKWLSFITQNISWVMTNLTLTATLSGFVAFRDHREKFIRGRNRFAIQDSVMVAILVITQLSQKQI